ncbi:Torulene dioxygenase [Purpureocillium takamizusanense]|uniref:Torulene dioxygenase n=1 Tax=Purpureocillium takamizusanense TaxID=2060973 RepID=A0A9Q8V872_9HYPO|nr:Torulene dioxygenase [Purpureocillium takamizusanense]UNI15512.1 Torulene dioxygenase [Purpureocillium takamizusanense]
MALNESGVIRRPIDTEAQDSKQQRQNFETALYKEWPNHAGFEHLDEHRGPVKLLVKGNIPSFAAGSLYRTGPGQSAVEDTARGTHYVSHWFDGFAHTHKFDILAPEEDGGDTTVIYSSRRQSEEHVAAIKKIGWRHSTSFGQRADPCVGRFAKFMSFFKPHHENNSVVVLTNVPGLPDKRPENTTTGHRTGTRNVYLSTDNDALQEIDPDALEPLGYTKQVALHPDLKGPLSCAHAQRDPETGDYFNFNIEVGRKTTYRVFRVNAAVGTTDILAAITEPDLAPAYIHSFFLTENYVVLCVPSSHYGWSGLKILWENNLLDALKPFDKSRRCKWFVVDRRHDKGVVARFSTPAGFFFHSINAFEKCEKDETGQERTVLNMDLTMYETTDIMLGLYYDVILDRKDAAKAYWEKWGHQNLATRHARVRFPMPTCPQTEHEGAAAEGEEVLSIPSPHSGELSTIHPGKAGKPYRYVYGAGSRGLSTFMDSIVKTDLKTREAVLWSGPPAHSPCEPIFVPRPGGASEDDGVVLTVVLDGTAQRSYLLCLDAATMEEVGRAEADFAIGIGFHGHHASAL